MSEPQITVLMSVYNGEAFVAQSVTSILEQSFRAFEFIVIDDASTDATAEILAAIKDPRLKVSRNETNLGLTASLNRGLALARGEFVARQDADDLSHLDRLAHQANFLQANPTVAAVGSQAHLIDEQGRSQGRKDFPLEHRGIWWAHLFDNALAHSSVMFRRPAVSEAGGYDEQYRASQDYELWSRLGEKHRLANLADRLVTLRILSSSVTRTHRQPDLIRSIQSVHSLRLFPGRGLSDAELDLIGQFRHRVGPASLKPFRELFNELLAVFQAAWPDTRTSSDFRRTLSLLHERIGYNLLPVARADALAEIACAVGCSPARLFSIPWARIAALLLLGDSARKAYEWLMPAKRTLNSSAPRAVREVASK